MRRMEVDHDQYRLPSDDSKRFDMLARRSNIDKNLFIQALDGFWMSQQVRLSYICSFLFTGDTDVSVRKFRKSNDMVAESVEKVLEQGITSPFSDKNKEADTIELAAELFNSGAAFQREAFEEAGIDTENYSQNYLRTALTDMYIDDKKQFPHIAAQRYREKFASDLNKLTGKDINTPDYDFDSLSDVNGSELDKQLVYYDVKLDAQNARIEYIKKDRPADDLDRQLGVIEKSHKGIVESFKRIIHLVHIETPDKDDRIDAAVELFRLAASKQQEAIDSILEIETAGGYDFEQLRQEIAELYDTHSAELFVTNVTEKFDKEFGDDIRQVREKVCVQPIDAPELGTFSTLNQVLGDYTQELLVQRGLIEDVYTSSEIQALRSIDELEGRSMHLSTLFSNSVMHIFHYTEDVESRVAMITELFLALGNSLALPLKKEDTTDTKDNTEASIYLVHVRELYDTCSPNEFRKKIRAAFNDLVYGKIESIQDFFSRDNDD